MQWGKIALASCAMGLLALGAAQADVMKDREALMKGFGQRVGVIKGALVEGKGSIEDAAAAAQQIADGAPKIPSVFPEGSNGGESEALPVIWQKWPEFEAKATNMQHLAAELATAAKGGDKSAAMAAFANLGKNGCGGCHEQFRQKKS